MINFNHIKLSGNLVRVEVKLEGKVVGDIRPVDGGWAYFPKLAPKRGGKIVSGKTYPTVQAAKQSLFTDEDEDQTPPTPDFANMTFEEKVRADFYKNPLPYGPSAEAKVAYRDKEGELHGQFMTDLGAYLVSEGVPAQYVGKVSYAAWEDGHSSGYSEVLNSAYKFIEIFK
jgi:hypothetical protein